MIWEEIKKILKEGVRCAIVEDGEIKGVLTSWEDYQKMVHPRSSGGDLNPSSITQNEEELIRADLAKMIEEEPDFLDEDFDSDIVKIEDLPID